MPEVTLQDFLTYLPELLRGAKLTVLLTIVIFILSIILGLIVALGRMSPYRVVRIPLSIFVEFIRGTPGLVQIYYIFYVLPFWGVTLDAIAAGILGLTLNYGAYISEVIRSGIQAVPHTQREAATTIGLNYVQTLRFVILPQSFRVVMAPLVNYLLSLFKDTSLLSAITIQELLFSGLLIASTTYNHFVIFTEIAIIYFIICYPVALLATYLEARMKSRRPWNWKAALSRTLPGLSRA